MFCCTFAVCMLHILFSIISLYYHIRLVTIGGQLRWAYAFSGSLLCELLLPREDTRSAVLPWQVVRPSVCLFVSVCDVEVS